MIYKGHCIEYIRSLIFLEYVALAQLCDQDIDPDELAAYLPELNDYYIECIGPQFAVKFGQISGSLGQNI